MEKEQSVTVARTYSNEEKQLIVQTVAKGATPTELAYFLYVCAARGLNPLVKQIHFIKRKQKQKDGSFKDIATIQTGIDGLRLIAQRSGTYAPSSKPTEFSYDADGKLESATVWGVKLIHDQPFEFCATAYWDEYYPSDPPSQFMWNKMPRGQLEKCAEAKMLRRGWPEESSGLYIPEEMQQAGPVIEAEWHEDQGQPEPTPQLENKPEPSIAEPTKDDWSEWWGKVRKELNLSPGQVSAKFGKPAREYQKETGKTLAELYALLGAPQPKAKAAPPKPASAPLKPIPAEGDITPDDLPFNPEPTQRDSNSIRSNADLFQACLDDFGMSRESVLHELGVEDEEALVLSPAANYRTIRNLIHGN